MGRVPITVMGFRCERCTYEWIPRDNESEPKTCPKCRSPYWDRPRKNRAMTPYEDFRDTVQRVLREAGKELTWTEIRTMAKLQQKFPNNQYVRRMEQDIGLVRKTDAHGIIHWQLKA